MKKLLSITFIMISVIFMNCSTPEQEVSAIVQADKQLALKVDGMVCAMGCANYIQKQVAKMDGVSDCNVSFEDGTASIEFSSDVTGEKEIIEAITAINDGQYSVTVVELSNVKESQSGPRGDNKEETETKVSFQFPELITYFLSHIISRS